jgi:hypothetical protein
VFARLPVAQKQDQYFKDTILSRCIACNQKVCVSIASTHMLFLIDDAFTWTTTGCDEDRSCSKTALSLRIVADAFRRSSTPTPTGIFDEFYSQAGIAQKRAKDTAAPTVA